MPPNRNLRIHNAHTLRSPPPTISCSYCPRHFLTRAGRTKHIQAYHNPEPAPHESSPSASPPPLPFPSPYTSPHPPSPIPSDNIPPPLDYIPRSPSNYSPPSANASSPFIDDMTPPWHGDDSVPDSNDESNLGGAFLSGDTGDPQVPYAPSITRAHHPTLDGKLAFLSRCISTKIKHRADLR